MANVAHLVRASGCGSEGSGFDPHHSPQNRIGNFMFPYFILGCNHETEPTKWWVRTASGSSQGRKPDDERHRLRRGRENFKEIYRDEA